MALGTSSKLRKAEIVQGSLDGVHMVSYVSA